MDVLSNREIEQRRFDENVNLIKKLANKYSKLYHKDFDDMYEVGLEYYVWTLQHYDARKGSKFSTYLYQQVAERMVDECIKQSRQISMLYSDIKSDNSELFDYESLIAAPEDLTEEHRDNKQLLMDIAKEELSYEGFLLLKWILSYKWVTSTSNNKPNKLLARKELGLSYSAIQMVWSEVEYFWKEISPELMVA